jgi:hypothetical protein
VLIHTAALNLGVLMRAIVGVGTPRSLQGKSRVLSTRLFAIFHWLIKGQWLYCSFLAFVVAQIIIDLEPLYHILRHEWPLHRTLHTVIGASAAGSVAALCVIGGRVLVSHIPPHFHTAVESLPESQRSEITNTGVWAGGLVGGVPHPLLDSMMLADVHPFAPLTNANPFLGIIDDGLLHMLCVAAGIFGLVLIAVSLKVPKSKAVPLSRVPADHSRDTPLSKQG